MLLMKMANCSAGDLDWEIAVLFSHKGVNLLASILINRCTNGPNKAEGKPEFHHCTKIVFVRSFYLEIKKKKSYNEAAYANIIAAVVIITVKTSIKSTFIPRCWMWPGSRRGDTEKLLHSAP